MGMFGVKKLAFVAALCGSFICSPVHAKTFVGVLWPMFGPLPAIGLVELVAELKTIPDVEVHTYLHQEWPALVEDLSHQAPGTHTFVIGYSLGANATAFVANKSKYIDLIVALQPSMLSWNPPVTGKVGRMIEVYNPNPWLTFGGMGSKKLEGPNIEYIANTDSHPGAQFNLEFRGLVKTELAKFADQDRLLAAQNTQTQGTQAQNTQVAAPLAYAQSSRSSDPKALDDWLPHQAKAQATKDGVAKDVAAKDVAAKDRAKTAQIDAPKSPQPAQLEHVVLQRPQQMPKESVALLDTLSNAVDSGDLSRKRELTLADMTDYASRAYGVSPKGDKFAANQNSTLGDDVIAAAFSRSGPL
jgi:hypothetical protein